MENKLTNNTDKIDFEDLEARINSELDHLANNGFTAFTTPLPSYFELSLAQLLSLKNQEFVEACFCRVLGREADQASVDHYLKKLHKGYDPRAIIVFLRYSAEGEKRFEEEDHALPSLHKYRIFGLPVIGQIASKIFSLYQKMH